MSTGRDQGTAARLAWAPVALALALLVSGWAIGGIDLGGNLLIPTLTDGPRAPAVVGQQAPVGE